jgi:glycosyltransferase involved in cell wall biosynthesis
MRISYDHQIFFLQNYGGISRYFTNLAQGLVDKQQQVRIFAPLHRNNYLTALPEGVVDGKSISKVFPKTARFIAAYNFLVSNQKIANWQPDIIHETYYSRFGSAPKNCPTVITVYDMIHELFCKDFTVRDNTTKLKKIAVARADHVICISDNTKQDLMKLFGTPSSKISVIHLGFEQFNAEVTSVASSEVLYKPFILYVGSRSGYKNFMGFLKSIASSKKLLNDFQIVAFGGGGFSVAELSIIKSLGFASNQVKQVTGNDTVLTEFYRKARAFIYPSLYEGFGIPPLEAMAQQCPLISSNASSMPEVIGDAAEFFTPTSTDDMCRAIEAVVYSDARIGDLKNKGLARLNAFSWNKCTQETLEVYRSLAGKN